MSEAESGDIEPRDAATDDAWKEEVKRRVEQVANGTAASVSFDEAIAKLRKPRLLHTHEQIDKALGLGSDMARKAKMLLRQHSEGNVAQAAKCSLPDVTGETWTWEFCSIETDAEDEFVSTACDGWDSHVDVGPGWERAYNAANIARNHLMAAAPELYRLVKELTYTHMSPRCDWVCTRCGAKEDSEHEADCTIGRVLKKARGDK